jgi:single-stranded-DNA-specific exonuclease
MPEKRWEFKSYDSEKVAALYEELPIHPVLCQLLVQRGITSYHEAKRFFRPSFDHLHDPFLMEDMPAAVQRIEKALQNEEKILIYGDYDVDGTTAVALCYDFLSQLHDNITFYIPDRYKEGYGLSDKAIKWAEEQEVDLLITLDCGIKGNKQISQARQHDIDVIVCDHHTPGEELPPACAVLDPKRTECAYPYDELSGCGIGFKLLQALLKQRGQPVEELRSYLDLVAVSIASDIVPITGENRILAQLGLEVLTQQPRPGLKALGQLSGLWPKEEESDPPPISVSDIVFKIGPRINAAGRMDDAQQAVKTLIAPTEREANNYAQQLNNRNNQRKEFDQQTTREAVTLIRENKWQHRKSTVLFHPEWHKGVIGIVASRLIEDHFYRPTVIFTASNGKVAGSARSVPGFNLYEALEQCSDLVEQFGGHKYAAGLTLPKENVQPFTERFEEVVSKSITDELLTPRVSIDAESGVAVRGSLTDPTVVVAGLVAPIVAGAEISIGADDEGIAVGGPKSDVEAVEMG